MEDTDFRSIEAGAIQRLGLRRIESSADSKEDEAEKKKAGVGSKRRATKGVAMEVVVAEALTRLDHPEKVQSFWTLSGPGSEPKSFAPPYTPDLLVPATPGAASFQIICEVSSGRHMTRQYLRIQLDSALRHCAAAHEAAREAREKVEVTYGLLVNSAQIGTDSQLRGAYRRFIADNEKVLGGSPLGSGLPHDGSR